MSQPCSWTVPPSAGPVLAARSLFGEMWRKAVSPALPRLFTTRGRNFFGGCGGLGFRCVRQVQDPGGFGWVHRALCRLGAETSCQKHLRTGRYAPLPCGRAFAPSPQLWLLSKSKSLPAAAAGAGTDAANPWPHQHPSSSQCLSSSCRSPGFPRPAHPQHRRATETHGRRRPRRAPAALPRAEPGRRLPLPSEAQALGVFPGEESRGAHDPEHPAEREYVAVERPSPTLCRTERLPQAAET